MTAVWFSGSIEGFRDIWGLNDCNMVLDGFYQYLLIGFYRDLGFLQCYIRAFVKKMTSCGVFL